MHPSLADFESLFSWTRRDQPLHSHACTRARARTRTHAAVCRGVSQRSPPGPPPRRGTPRCALASRRDGRRCVAPSRASGICCACVSDSTARVQVCQATAGAHVLLSRAHVPGHDPRISGAHGVAEHEHGIAGVPPGNRHRLAGPAHWLQGCVTARRPCRCPGVCVPCARHARAQARREKSRECGNRPHARTGEHFFCRPRTGRAVLRGVSLPPRARSCVWCARIL